MTSVKYLGVDVDDRLKWDVHVTNLTNRLRKTVYKFVQLRHILRPDLLKTVYYALVESLLTYGTVVWGGAYKTTLDQLYKIL